MELTEEDLKKLRKTFKETTLLDIVDSLASLDALDWERDPTLYLTLIYEARDRDLEHAF